MKSYGVRITANDLIKADEKYIVDEIGSFIQGLDLESSTSQERAWNECVSYLVNTFTSSEGIIKDFEQVEIIFEFCIPLSCYRRPDIIMLFEDTVLVLEFKRKDISLESDKSQLRGYLNELRNYHEVTHLDKLNVIGALVVTEAKDSIYEDNGIDIIKGNMLKDYLSRFSRTGINQMSDENVTRWLKSDYKPLLSIIDATIDMFLNGDIPQIRNIEEGKIKKTQDIVFDLVNNNSNKKRIIFLSGVPGAGKTLILLNTLYKLNAGKEDLNSLFTSGNGPLISTLSYILSKDKSKMDGEAFIKDIKSVKSTYYNKNNDCPIEGKSFFKNIFFDESQRSWDFEHMNTYKFKVSEPELLLRIQNKSFEYNESCNLVCSYGDGQSIYLGEEGGFNIWSNVLNKEEYNDFEVYIPTQYEGYFKDRDNTFVIDDLFIDTSIRGNFIDLDPFINAVLEVDKESAANELHKVISKGFDIRVSRSFNEIKNNLEDKKDKFYGLIVSSNASIKTLEGCISNFSKILTQSDNSRIGKWYVEDCKNLVEAAAEFGCQGLELNLPILIFGRYYIIKEGKWIINPKVEANAQYGTKISKYKNKEEIFKNIYRVLLSRGRKGIILFIPEECIYNGRIYKCSDLEETYKFFRMIGVKNLQD